jgi:P27 family predicted phage terminase small subunit
LTTSVVKWWRAVWTARDGAYHPATDRFVIERYCELHDHRAALLREVEIDGLTIVGSTGQTVINPACGKSNEQRTKCAPSIQLSGSISTPGTARHCRECCAPDDFGRHLG